jgi:hypothetical protein
MRSALIAVTILWVAIFVATVAGADVFGSVHVPFVHQALILFALVMAALVPDVFIRKLRHNEAQAIHYAAIGAWGLFVFSIFHEVVL